MTLCTIQQLGLTQTSLRNLALVATILVPILPAIGIRNVLCLLPYVLECEIFRKTQT